MVRTPRRGRLLDAASACLRVRLKIQHLALVGLAVAGALSIFLLELISSTAAPRTPGLSVFAGNLTPPPPPEGPPPPTAPLSVPPVASGAGASSNHRAPPVSLPPAAILTGTLPA